MSIINLVITTINKTLIHKNVIRLLFSNTEGRVRHRNKKSRINGIVTNKLYPKIIQIVLTCDQV